MRVSGCQRVVFDLLTFQGSGTAHTRISTYVVCTMLARNKGRRQEREVFGLLLPVLTTVCVFIMNVNTTGRETVDWFDCGLVLTATQSTSSEQLERERPHAVARCSRAATSTWASRGTRVGRSSSPWSQWAQNATFEIG